MKHQGMREFGIAMTFGLIGIASTILAAHIVKSWRYRKVEQSL